MISLSENLKDLKGSSVFIQIQKIEIKKYKLLMNYQLLVLMGSVLVLSISLYVKMKPESVPTERKFVLISKTQRPSTYYTQGFFYDPNDFSQLIESSGQYGNSFVNLLDAETYGELYSIPMKSEYFGEGSSILRQNELYVLTWREKVCVVYELDSKNKKITEINEIAIPSEIGQGWGVATDGEHLFISNGSNYIYIVQARREGMEIVNKIEVKDNKNRKRRLLNELEFVEGTLFANVFTTNKILNIDIQSGQVLQEWVMPNEMKEESIQNVPLHLKREAVLNGIAYHPEDKHFLITGKLWSNVYKMRLQ